MGLYRTRVQSILKSGKYIEHWSDNIERDDREMIIDDIAAIRAFMQNFVAKSEEGEPLDHGYIHVGPWQIDAMELAAFAIDLYEVEDDGQGCYNEKRVEVPMP